MLILDEILYYYVLMFIVVREHHENMPKHDKNTQEFLHKKMTIANMCQTILDYM